MAFAPASSPWAMRRFNTRLAKLLSKSAMRRSKYGASSEDSRQRRRAFRNARALRNKRRLPATIFHGNPVSSNRRNGSRPLTGAQHRLAAEIEQPLPGVVLPQRRVRRMAFPEDCLEEPRHRGEKRGLVGMGELRPADPPHAGPLSHSPERHVRAGAAGGHRGSKTPLPRSSFVIALKSLIRSCMSCFFAIVNLPLGAALQPPCAAHSSSTARSALK